MTLADPDPETSATMTPLGFNPLHQYRVYVVRRPKRIPRPIRCKVMAYRTQYATYNKPNFFAAILQIAQKTKIRILLFFYPYHAEYLEMLHDLGLWPSFEAWKRVVLDLIARTGEDVLLFDFAEYDELTTETAPPADDRRATMRWCWEPGHFKSALGDRILEAMFRTSASAGKQLGFGHLLTLTNIEAVLTDVRRQRLQFLGDQPMALEPEAQ